MGQGGNVWEWNETAHDGVYNTVGESLDMRGGSWDIGSDYLEASYRNYYVDPAIDGNNYYGFRVVVMSDFNSTINNGEVTITGYTGAGGAVVIPATIGGLPVTTIGEKAFLSNQTLTAVTIPEGVTTIRAEAFAGCGNMAAITLPNSLTSIGNYAFQGCAKLISVIIPNSVISLGANAFESCTNLANVILPSNLTLIQSGTFFACPNLATITIPGSVTEIQFNAFMNCTSLASGYFLGNTPPTIGENAFAGIAAGAVGYYPAAASSAWASFTQIGGLTIVHPVYDFNSLSNGNLNGQDGWKTSVYGTGGDGQVITWTSNGSKAVQYDRSGSNFGVSGTRLNNAAYRFPQQGAGKTIVEIDVQPAYWGMVFGMGLDANGDGLFSTADIKNSSASNTDMAWWVKFGKNENGWQFYSKGTAATTTGNGGTGNSLTYARVRVVLDYAANGGSGSASVFVRDLEVANSAFAPVSELQNLSLGLDAVATGVTNPRNWNGLGFHIEGATGVLDNLSISNDTDGDGLADQVETRTGTYVSATNTGTNPSNSDSDNDGLNDGEEVVTYGTNPLLADTDGDGAPDGVEVTAGTNPKQNFSLPKPVITSQPVSITNTAVGSATFSVTATNPAGAPSGLTYQWKKNTNIISGQTNQTLNLAPLTVLQSGSYSVVVANIYGSTNSTVATLTVTKATPTITLIPTATPIAYGQTLAFSTLSGGVASVPGSFAWTAPSTLPSAGTVSQGVTFNPTDTANYNTVTASVNVTVNQALISSGFSHTLYLGAGASTVTAWGMNTDGRLGVGDMNSPVNWAKAVQGIPLGYTVTGLAAGGTHSLILANGKVYAAGSDRFGQLGQGAVDGANKTSFNPVAIPSSTPVAVAAGGNHSLIVTADGEVFACGDNTYGQLAQPATTLSSGTLVEVVFPGLSTKIVSVVAGADHNLAVDEGGGVWVWGRNDSGQLGKNTRTLGVVADRTPVRIISSGAKSVAAGFAHSLVLKQDGTVLGFGRNNSGQTGQSATSSVVLVPTLISGLSGIRSISAGTDSSFAINQLGRLYSWGYNSYGELLLGYSSPSSSPAVYGPRLSTIATNVFNVAGGGYSSLAVGAQGVIFGGRNDVGQAGNGPDPDEVVGDYYYGAGDLALTNLTMDLAGTTETLYDQIFVGNGAVTLNGILNLMFVGTYTGPVYGSPQTFDLIWAQNGITLGTDYKLAFNQSGYWAETERVAQDGGEVLRATVGAVVTAADLAQAVQTANPVLHQVQSVSYKSTGLSSLSLGSEMEMIYSYERPTGGVTSGAEYFVGGTTYRVQQGSSLSGPWSNASVSGTTVTPLGNGRERVTLRISASGSAGFLRLEVVLPPET
jgi:hypothetical protein